MVAITPRIESPWSSLRSFVRHMFIVPDAQRRIWDLEYQLYVFELFHQRPVNRWSHFVGIPMQLAALMVLALRIPVFGPALIVACIATHVLIARRSGFGEIVLPLLLAHAVMLTLCWAWLEPQVATGTTWLRSPLFHVFAWPVLQYFTHALEPLLPSPWSHEGKWTRLTRFFREAPWRRIACILAFAPLHAFVEVISSWRNFVIVVLCAVQAFHRGGDVLRQSRARIGSELASPDPALDAVSYVRHQHAG